MRANGVKKSPRRNINFRQTPREFRAQRQTSIFMHIHKNVPFMHHFSRRKFADGVQKLNSIIEKQRGKFKTKSTFNK